MKIIDFERKGNVVRFYLGEKTEDWGWTNPDYKDYHGNTPHWLKPCDRFYGDDWNDKPYECNAGKVYEEFIKGYKDVSFSFDDLVLEPCDGEWNSPWCKDDMVDRKVPCIIVVPAYVIEDHYETDFSYWYNQHRDEVFKFFFGDEMQEEAIFREN